jgi:hypothetical protein
MRLIARTYEKHFPDIPITINQAISDYELALMDAVPEVFGQAQARECWFHYGQAISGKQHSWGSTGAKEPEE